MEMRFCSPVSHHQSRNCRANAASSSDAAIPAAAASAPLSSRETEEEGSSGAEEEEETSLAPDNCIVQSLAESCEFRLLIF